MIYYTLYFEMNAASRPGTILESWYWSGSACYWRNYP